MNDVTPISGALPVGYESFAQYGQEAASNADPFLRFSKGEWLLGASDEEVDLGRRFAANMAELAIGWIRWAVNKPIDRLMGLLSEGYRPKPRDALGFTDQALWDRDKDKKPIDPWRRVNELPLADVETEEAMIFSTSSRGGIGAVGNLCKSYARGLRQHPGAVPIIEIGRDSYRHDDFGKVYVPVFTIVDWIDGKALTAMPPPTTPPPIAPQLAGDEVILDDSIPF